MIPPFKLSDFHRHVGILLSGSTLAQLIPLLSELVLVRLFTPAEFGVLALFLSVATLIASVATARYNFAIVLPKGEDAAINVLALSLFITLCVVTPLSAVAVWFFPHTIASWMDSPNILPFLPWVPLFVLLSGIYSALFQWSTRKGYFMRMASSRISQSTGTAVVSIGTGLLLWRALGLVVGQIAGWAMGVLSLAHRFWQHDRGLWRQVSWQQMRQQAWRYIQFPTINSMHVLSDEGKQSLSNILIARYFSEATLGLYSRMLRIVKVPMGFIGSSVGQVFFQEAGQRWHTEQRIAPLYRKNMMLMAMIGLPIFGVVVLWGPAIFAWVLGEQWRVAGEYAQWLSVGMYSVFVLSPFSTLPMLASKQLAFFVYSLISNIAVVLCFVVAHYWGAHITIALLMVSVVQLIFNGFLAFWFHRLIVQRHSTVVP